MRLVYWLNSLHQIEITNIYGATVIAFYALAVILHSLAYSIDSIQKDQIYI